MADCLSKFERSKSLIQNFSRAINPPKKALKNTVGKGENNGYQHFLLFTTTFFVFSTANFTNSFALMFSSASDPFPAMFFIQ